MKGENERGEKKGKEGRKITERGKKERGKKERKKSSTAGLEPATFHSTANCLQLPPEVDLHARTYISRISIVMN